jgi:hypothetical protein
VPNGNDPDRLSNFVQLVDHDVVPDHEPPQVRIDLIRKAPAQERVFGQGLNTLEEVLNDAPCGCRIFLGNEVEKLRGPLLG